MNPQKRKWDSNENKLGWTLQNPYVHHVGNLSFIALPVHKYVIKVIRYTCELPLSSDPLLMPPSLIRIPQALGKCQI